ncbi:MAG TPA: 2-amino-4-hydroxy-6-hydroxymethyldihydropteridine diphosphokinase, partial [Flavobacteriales bacterium]|nr:2-amino-4-hydroxy-6-hydroxymethyldihydropteridine diphosphokinase [Flavobacteriales bacterium]
MNDVVLALGTNLGNRTENLQQALNYINILIGPVIKQSKIYETKAVGFDGHDFLNMTVLIQTDQMPDVLLKKTQSIEKLLGRTKKSQNQIYQNRLIDIDILYFNNHIFKSDNLTIPHP